MSDYYFPRRNEESAPPLKGDSDRIKLVKRQYDKIWKRLDRISSDYSTLLKLHGYLTSLIAEDMEKDESGNKLGIRLQRLGFSLLAAIDGIDKDVKAADSVELMGRSLNVINLDNLYSDILYKKESMMNEHEKFIKELTQEFGSFLQEVHQKLPNEIVGAFKGLFALNRKGPLIDVWQRNQLFLRTTATLPEANDEQVACLMKALVEARNFVVNGQPL